MKTKNFYLLLLISAIVFVIFSVLDYIIPQSAISLTSILIVISYIALFTGIVKNIVNGYKLKKNNKRFIFRHLTPQATWRFEPYSEFIIPKNIVPYEFYCSSCKETYFGFTVFCPRCERRMQQPRLEKKQDNKITCVICYKENCPICERKITGEDTCYEECPFCERTYHKHCWENTIKTFGKCGFCLEIPPSEMVCQIFKITPKDSESSPKKRDYIVSKPIDLTQVKQESNTKTPQKSEEMSETKPVLH